MPEAEFAIRIREEKIQELEREIDRIRRWRGRKADELARLQAYAAELEDENKRLKEGGGPNDCSGCPYHYDHDGFGRGEMDMIRCLMIEGEPRTSSEAIWIHQPLHCEFGMRDPARRAKAKQDHRFDDRPFRTPEMVGGDGDDRS